MCGLAALFEPGRTFEAGLIAAMQRDLYHRGPDSGGRLSEPGAAFAFRRLAILDPTPGADQPMTDPSGRCTIVFNGEIYNYQALREALAQAGVELRTQGDTEAVLEGYRLWGESVLERLEGMYAFVLLDRARGLALAARDPFGIKPLYMLRRGRLVALASEMRPLLRLVEPRPDREALAELLTFRWAAGRLSNLEGIERVPGGTLLRISLVDGDVRERRFFDVLDTFDPVANADDASATREVAEALRRSVRAHLASDVGYSVQLSGGVDSSLIAALAREEAKAPIRSFGIHLGEDFVHDESRWRAPVVDRYSLEHREIRLSGRDFADALPKAVRHMEGPSPHLGCVLLMLLCRHIRPHSKVVLTGEGADEFFGGYDRYRRWRRIEWQERIGRLLPSRAWPRFRLFHGVRRLAGVDAAAFGGVYDDFRMVHRLFPGLVPAPGARESASRRFRDFRDRLFAVDQTAYLESLLVRQDKMAMAESVEARVPFVHLPLARVVNRLPRRLRAPGGEPKALLKRIAEAHLPRDLLYRRKVGLLTPIDRWLRDPEGLGRHVADLTAPDCRLAIYGEAARIRATVDAFRRGRRDLAWLVMRLVNVEAWLRSLSVGSDAASPADDSTASPHSPAVQWASHA
jgi:asparagine synthase (glutamine-hydrolysing)